MLAGKLGAVKRIVIDSLIFQKSKKKEENWRKGVVACER